MVYDGMAIFPTALAESLRPMCNPLILGTNPTFTQQNVQPCDCLQTCAREKVIPAEHHSRRADVATSTYEAGNASESHDSKASVLYAGDHRFDLGEMIYRETFESNDAAAYWVEGNEGRVWVESGRLIIDGNLEEEPVVTVFIDREFFGDLYFSYETEVVASNTAKRFPYPKDVNNLNTFLYVSDPSGQHLRSTKDDRRNAAYQHYHSLNGYIVTFLNGYIAQLRQNPTDPGVSPGTGRIRLRENPGFVLKKEAFAERSEQGRIYRLQFIYYEGELLFFVDDVFQLGFSVSPERRLERGYFAFRTFSTKMAVDNFEVRHVTRRRESNTSSQQD